MTSQRGIDHPPDERARYRALRTGTRIPHQPVATHYLVCAGDLALEYQITRPGPGRDHLARLLTPLDPHPDLLATVLDYLRSEHSRLAAGRALGVHPNTVTNRLDKAGHVLGLDLTRLESLWQLRAAVIVRRFLRPE